MKRKLLIEIDCEDLHCGKCEHIFNECDACDMYPNNGLKYDDLAGMYLRLDVCINSEVKE